jgi:uncharacterized protein (DUF2147 family)
MRRGLIIGIVFVLISVLQVSAQKKDDILGYWLDEKQETVVRIYEDNGLYFGKIEWVKDSLDVFGNIRRDVLNDEPELRSRTVLGADMLIGFEWDGEGAWRKGEIYYYQTGNDYNGKIYLDEGKLKLKGYFSILFFLGRTKTWERLDNPKAYGLE